VCSEETPSLAEKIADRANAEGFEVSEFDKCSKMTDQLKTGLGFELTDAAKLKMLGLSSDATEQEELERCIISKAGLILDRQKGLQMLRGHPPGFDII